MSITFTKNLEKNNITFTSKKSKQKDKNKEAGKKVVTGGGAVVATASTLNRAKTARKGFDMFASASRLSNGMTTITETSGAINTAAKKTYTLWGKVCENAKWLKTKIIKWADKFKNMKYIKPLLESKVFRFTAGAIGYIFGAMTLISGLTEISKAATNTLQKTSILDEK